MASYVITGANRGLGLALTQQLLKSPASEVGKIFAVSRSAPSGAFKELIDSNTDRVVPITAAVDNTESVQKAAKEVETKLAGHGLDVLINNAGVGPWHPEGVKSVTPEDLTKVFDVNVGGPQRVTVAFLPLLEKGNLKKVINV